MITPNLFFEYSIRRILAAYESGELTPTDVAIACIAQVERLEPACQAWVRFDPDRLLAQAKETEARLAKGEALRLLEGIPVGVKDMFNTVDFPTEMGSPLWKDFTPGNDARVVFNLKREGALIPGKTVTAEFAVHTLGKTLNPHNPTYNPGTSSSGSAAAIATGMAPVTLGTQTAGSIVRPASFCGVYGCKPSFGLIPRMGMLKTTDSLDTVGFFALHYEDLQRVFEAVRVHGQNYPLSHAALSDEARQCKPEGRPWRVAFIRPYVWDQAYPYAQQAMRDWTAKLAATGEFEISEVELPADVHQAHAVHATIYNKTLSYYFQSEYQRAELVSPIMNQLIEAGQKITPAQYQQALKDQEQIAHRVDALLSDYDVAVTLSTAGEAPLRDDTERPDSALIWNMAFLPVIGAPVFSSPNGLPFGVQLLSRRYNDYLLFRFADRLRELGLIPSGPNPLAACVSQSGHSSKNKPMAAVTVE